MTQSHSDIVSERFGSVAAAYVGSAVHSRGADLDALEARVERLKPARALDLGCGGGHVAYLMARHAAAVTACDLSEQMLAAVRANAAEKGIKNITTVPAAAQSMPFADGEFDFLACRFSAHHWSDFEGGLREARRVLRPGTAAEFIDVYSPGPPLLDTYLQALELLRDPSHVRNQTAAEWTAALGRSGFRVMALHTWRLRMEFGSWIARTGTSELHAQAIKSLQAAASSEVRRHFAIEADGSFHLDVLSIEATPA